MKIFVKYFWQVKRIAVFGKGRGKHDQGLWGENHSCLKIQRYLLMARFMVELCQYWFYWSLSCFVRGGMGESECLSALPEEELERPCSQGDLILLRKLTIHVPTLDPIKDKFVLVLVK